MKATEWKPEVGQLVRHKSRRCVGECLAVYDNGTFLNHYINDKDAFVKPVDIFEPIAELEGLGDGCCIYFYNNSIMYVWMIRHDVFLFGDEEVYSITDSCNNLVVSMQGKVYGLPIKFYRTADRAERLGG